LLDLGVARPGGDRTLSLEGRCSHCRFTRRFSRELAGRFYRCPKCKNGVLAVPLDSGDDSAELPVQLSTSSVDERTARTLARIQRAQEDPAEDSAKVAIRLDSGDAGDPFPSDSLDDIVAARARQRETEEHTLLDLTALEQRAAKAAAAESEPGLSKTSVAGDRPIPVDSPDPDARPNFRGEVAAIRKVLVECGLCGFHVQIPVEFFGKTVNCPSCQGNAVFTESTLDPIKDEILDRLALETAERRAIYNADEEPSAWRELWRSSAIKSFLVGVGLGLLVLFAMWSAMQVRRTRARAAMVEEAEQQGWRYARNAGEELFHQPWCRQLDGRRIGERISASELQERGHRLHACE